MSSRTLRNMIDDLNFGRASSTQSQIDDMLSQFASGKLQTGTKSFDISIPGGPTRTITFEFGEKNGRPIIKSAGEEANAGQLFSQLRIVEFKPNGSPVLNTKVIDDFANNLRDSISKAIPTAEGKVIADNFANLYKQQLLNSPATKELAQLEKGINVADANYPSREKGNLVTKDVVLDNPANANAVADELKAEDINESKFLDEKGRDELIAQITKDAQKAGVDTMSYLQRVFKNRPQAIARLEKIKNSKVFQAISNNKGLLTSLATGIPALTIALDKKALRDEAINRQKETNGCFLINLLTNEKTKISLLTCGDFDTGKVIQTCATQFYTTGTTINECPGATFNPCTADSKSRSTDSATPLVPNVCDKYVYKGTTPPAISGVTTLSACPDTVSSPCSGYCRTANFKLPENYELQCVDVDYMTIYMNLVDEIGYDSTTFFPPKVEFSKPSTALVIATAVLGTVFLLVAAYYFLYRAK